MSHSFERLSGAVHLVTRGAQSRGVGLRRRREGILAASLIFGVALTAAVLGSVPVASAKASKHSLPSITTVPIQVIQTSDGAVSYRSDGNGPPLVMIMGVGGSQDDWPPDLVNALAKHHHVIIFDNAGIGQTAMPPGTLTISAMADQTAALIEALNLGQPAVLGWSMGGMIAQALAVRHPGDLSRLVLAATCGGDGNCTLGPGAATTALELFPPNKAATQFPLYVAAIASYPNLYVASTAITDAQVSAIASWAAGTDPGGHGVITVPTLIGDGADDVLIPPSNSLELQASISGALLHIYPDAGHGFLIQDTKGWAERVDRFLAS
jgi:pimeloyl-ACP methyl ester carboxylesterase